MDTMHASNNAGTPERRAGRDRRRADDRRQREQNWLFAYRARRDGVVAERRCRERRRPGLRARLAAGLQQVGWRR